MAAASLRAALLDPLTKIDARAKTIMAARTRPLVDKYQPVSFSERQSARALTNGNSQGNAKAFTDRAVVNGSSPLRVHSEKSIAINVNGIPWSPPKWIATVSPRGSTFPRIR